MRGRWMSDLKLYESVHSNGTSCKKPLSFLLMGDHVHDLRYDKLTTYLQGSRGCSMHARQMSRVAEK